MPKSACAIHQVAFCEKKCPPINVSMTTNNETYVFDMNQPHPAHAWWNFRFLLRTNRYECVTNGNGRL